MKFCGGDAPEAMQMALVHSLSHYDKEKGSLKYYVMALARTIKRVNGNLVFVDFIDKTLSAPVDNEDELDAEVDLGAIRDFSDTVIEDMYLSIDKSKDVADLALSCMDMFLLLCESLINRDSSTKYYSRVFIDACLKLSKKCMNFNSMCIDIYNEYGDAMKKFLSYSLDKSSKWKEVDYSMIEQRRSRRIIMVDAFGNEIIDADRQEYIIKGSMQGKRIVRVNYEDAFNDLCDLFDYNDVSPIKFTIGSEFIVRTPGGSLTVVNPEATNIYELLKMEIVTNILKDTGGRFLNIGSECIYLLCEANAEVSVQDRVVAGVPLKFVLQEVDYEVC